MAPSVASGVEFADTTSRKRETGQEPASLYDHQLPRKGSFALKFQRFQLPEDSQRYLSPVFFFDLLLDNFEPVAISKNLLA
jgi:hypothetical protein